MSMIQKVKADAERAEIERVKELRNSSDDVFAKENKRLKAKIKELEDIIEVLNEDNEKVKELDIRQAQIEDVQEQLTKKCEEYELRLKYTEEKYSDVATKQAAKEEKLNELEKKLKNLNQEANRRAEKLYQKRDIKLRQRVKWLAVSCGVFVVSLIMSIILLW